MSERLTRDQVANANADKALENGAWDRWTNHPDHAAAGLADIKLPEPAPRFQHEIPEPSAETISAQYASEEMAGRLALDEMLELESHDQGELAMAGPPER